MAELEASLDAEIVNFRAECYALSTKKAYSCHKKKYIEFCLRCGYNPVPVSSVNLYRYVAYLARTLKPSSISKYLNIVRLMHLEAGLENPLVNNWGLDTILKGIKRVKGAEVIRKMPITPQILLKIQSILELQVIEDAVFWAACLVAFFGLLRKSNLFPPSAGGHDPSKHLSRDHFVFRPWGIELLVNWSKNNQYRERTVSIPLVNLPGHKLCPVTAVKWAFNLTISASTRGPAFVVNSKKGLKPLLYSCFVNKLKRSLSKIGLDSKQFSSHSFRRGGASWAAQIGLSGEMIQMMGDWHSDAYLLYMCVPLSSKIQNMVHFCSRLPVN